MTFSLLPTPSRRLLHALAGMTATQPFGEKLQGLTGGPSRNTPLNEDYRQLSCETWLRPEQTE
jgi:hypothetical protein